MQAVMISWSSSIVLYKLIIFYLLNASEQRENNCYHKGICALAQLA